MDVAARARAVGGELGHEGDAHAHALRNFLQALLEHDVAIGHLEHLGETHVQLVLALAPFALRVLDRHARKFEVPARRGVEAFGARALQHVVVLEVPAGGLEVAEVAAPPGGSSSGRGSARAPCRRSLHSLLSSPRRSAGAGSCAALRRRSRASSRSSHRTRRMPSCRARLRAAACHVRHHVYVAVTELPVRKLVARHRLHLHVDGQQVIARVPPCFAISSTNISASKRLPIRRP